jgi:hypothetical protein
MVDEQYSIFSQIIFIAVTTTYNVAELYMWGRAGMGWCHKFLHISGLEFDP